MALDGTLQHWKNGEPILPVDGSTELKYWLDGEPYIILDEVATGWTGIILNVTNPAKVNGIEASNIAKIMNV